MQYRIKQYGLVEGTDFTPFTEISVKASRPRKDYVLTLSCAKELAMVERILYTVITTDGLYEMKKYTDFEFQIDDKDANSSGVYTITNTVNNDAYIGSTHNFRKRYHIHRSNLKMRNHHSPKLQSFVDQYGFSVLRFQCIEFCCIADLPTRENYYLATLLPIFNTATDYHHKPMLGKKHSLLSKMKMAKVKRGKKATVNQRAALLRGATSPRSEQARKNMSQAKIGDKNPMRGKVAANVQAVSQLTLSGLLVAQYASMTEAQKATGIDVRNIQAVCKGRRRSSGGYLWEYRKEIT